MPTDPPDSAPAPFAPMPEPPYHAVIFASQLSDDRAGYDAMAKEMMRLAACQPGFLGAESARDSNGFGITISYWRNARSLAAWKREAHHLGARKLGRERWYRHYTLRVARVERAYDGP